MLLLTLMPFAAWARPLLVGYFGQWGIYDERFFVQNLVASGAAEALDQINYAQGSVASGRCGIADVNADLNLVFDAKNSVDGRADATASPFRGDMHQLALLKQRHPHLRVIISLEGRARDFAFAARPENRVRFIASCVDTFLRGKLATGVEAPGLFDGIDLDWEYPHGGDAANYIALLKELRSAMDAVRPGLMLSVAVGPSPRMYGGVDFRQVAALVDQVGMMNYDYTGPWNHETGLMAPLHARESYSVERTAAAYEQAGIPRAKLLLGLPFYGYGWRRVPRGENDGLHQRGTGIHTDEPYHYFQDLMDGKAPQEDEEEDNSQQADQAEQARPALLEQAHPFRLYRDPESGAPWLYDGSTFWTFDDPQSIRTKAAFAARNGLGGVMIWELSGDTRGGRLLHAASEGLGR